MNIREIEFKDELLREYAEKLLINGFRVFVSAKEFFPNQKKTYYYVVKDNNIGYVQLDYFGGLDFSTVNKPSKNHGTGYRINEEGHYKPTIKDAEDTFLLKPAWAHGSGKDIIKYKSWIDYANNTALKYDEVFL